MQHIILNPRHLLPRCLGDLLPACLLREIEEKTPAGEWIEEVRLRRERCASLTVGGRNLRLSTVLSGTEMDRLLLAMCEGSLYAHGESVCEGYLTLPEGVRVGVCGKAGVAAGRVTGVLPVTSFCIRIPHASPAVGEEIEGLLRRLSPSCGVLVFAPPAVGKTTLLRAVAARMAGGTDPRRVAVVDTRGELCYSLDGAGLLLDVLLGYPRGLGISIAARTLSAQLVVCDEIGSMEEAREITEAQLGGVPLLASAHSAELGELLSRPAMKVLHAAHCFGAYVRLSRAGDRDFSYEIWEWEKANEYL